MLVRVTFRTCTLAEIVSHIVDCSCWEDVVEHSDRCAAEYHLTGSAKMERLDVWPHTICAKSYYPVSKKGGRK